MINIPLPFMVIWGIMMAGVITHALYKIQKITDQTPDQIHWKLVLLKFANKEWPSYGISIISVTIFSYSLIYMKMFEKIDNDEITKWAKWIPLAVPILYVMGIGIQLLLYKFLGRILSKGEVNIDVLKGKE